MTIDDQSPSVEPSAQWTPPSLLSLLGYGLLCGLVSVLVALRTFAVVTLPHILTPDSLAYQGVPDGLPVTRLLDWNPLQIALMEELRDMNPVLLVLAAFLLFGFLFARTLRMLLPDLHLFHRMSAGVPEESGSPPPETGPLALDGKMMARIAGQFLLVALPLALLGGIAALVVNHFPKAAPALTAVWCVIAGIWLRTALRPGGIVVRGLHLPGVSSRRKRTVSHAREIGLGVVLGLLVFGMQSMAMRMPAQNVLDSMHAMGLFHIGRWHALGLHFLLSVGLAGFGTGLLLLVFAPLHTRPFPRFPLLVLAALCAPVALWLGQPYTPKALADRSDITPSLLLTARPYDPRFPNSGVPDGPDAAQRLAQLAGIPQGKQVAVQNRRFLLLAKNVTMNALQHGYTEDGLPADPDTVPKVEAFLRRRAGNTALAWTAFKHIYNVGNVHFDNTLSLRACLNDLETSPHNILVTKALRDGLFTVAASPQNLAILNEWADERYFAHPDRASLKLLGDLYMRFGEKEKALQWYTRADMPRSFMEEKRTDKPLFHAGVITGTLLWNGKPLAGVQVGAFPHLQNGLPKDLEGEVRAAERMIAPNFPFSDLFGFMEPRPYLFRWISAGTLTDSAGRFTLSHLTEGVYHLILTLPPDVTLKPFEDDRLHVANYPGDISIRYPTLRRPSPVYDLGTIPITFKP